MENSELIDETEVEDPSKEEQSITNHKVDDKDKIEAAVRKDTEKESEEKKGDPIEDTEEKKEDEAEEEKDKEVPDAEQQKKDTDPEESEDKDDVSVDEEVEEEESVGNDEEKRDDEEEKKDEEDPDGEPEKDTDPEDFENKDDASVDKEVEGEKVVETDEETKDGPLDETEERKDGEEEEENDEGAVSDFDDVDNDFNYFSGVNDSVESVKYEDEHEDAEVLEDDKVDGTDVLSGEFLEDIPEGTEVPSMDNTEDMLSNKTNSSSGQNRERNDEEQPKVNECIVYEYSDEEEKTESTLVPYDKDVNVIHASDRVEVVLKGKDVTVVVYNQGEASVSKGNRQDNANIPFSRQRHGPRGFRRRKRRYINRRRRAERCSGRHPKR